MSSATARCSCLPLGAQTRARPCTAERPPQDRASSAKSPLAHFIESTAKVDDKVIAYMTETLQLKTVSDFANLWTAAEYEKGIQSDVIQKIPGFEDASQPLSRLQTARLRTACAGAGEGMGWTSPSVAGATFERLWEALLCTNPLKFDVEVSDVVVAERGGHLVGSMTINATQERVEEHIYADERNGEMIHRLVDPRASAEAVDERVIAVREDPLRLEFFRRHASEGHRLYWKRPLESVRQTVQELVGRAPQPGAEGRRGEAIEEISRDALWRSMVASVREPGRFFDCSGVSVRDREGFVEREVSTLGGEAYHEHIYAREESFELVFRRLAGGAEASVELAVGLRSRPARIEFKQRHKADGSAVNGELPESAVLSCVEALAREAKRLDSVQATTVGYGVTSDPICGPSYDSVFAAVELSIKEPWRVTDVDQGSCDVQDCEGYVLRRMTLGATGERIVARITVDKERGKVTYAKFGPGDVERVLAIHSPLRLELYDRNARSGLRVDSKAPCGAARDTFSKIVQLARELEAADAEADAGGPRSSPCAAGLGAA